MTGNTPISDGRREHLSALMDGEIQAEDGEAFLAAVIEQESMSEDWAVYHCIGDVLRSSDMGCHSSRLVMAVSERLREEPHWLVQPPKAAHGGGAYRRPLSALAAVAAVAAVGFVVWPQFAARDGAVVAAKAPAPARPVLTEAPRPQAVLATSVSSEYVAAHRQFSVGPALRASVVPQGQNVAFEAVR